MTLVSVLVLVFIFAVLCIGWVRLFAIHLSSLKVMLLGILLSVSGGLLSLVSTSLQLSNNFLSYFGFAILLLGLIFGVAGFLIKEVPTQD